MAKHPPGSGPDEFDRAAARRDYADAARIIEDRRKRDKQAKKAVAQANRIAARKEKAAKRAAEAKAKAEAKKAAKARDAAKRKGSKK